MAIDSQRRRVFVLDDETAVADTLAEILNGAGYEAYSRYTPQEILDLAAAVTPDLLITDVALGHEFDQWHRACDSLWAPVSRLQDTTHLRTPRHRRPPAEIPRCWLSLPLAEQTDSS